MNETLQKVLQAYFHQDWKEEFHSIREVASSIVDQNPPDLISNLVSEMSELLAKTATDDETTDILEKLNCDYVPSESRAWISELLRYVLELRIR